MIYSHPLFDSTPGLAPTIGKSTLVRTVTPTAALAFGTADTVRYARLKRGLKLGADAFIQSPGAGGTGVYSLEVTDGTITRVLIDQTNISQAGGIARPTKIPAAENAVGYVIPNNNFWLQLRMTAGTSGAAVSTVVGVDLCGHYEQGELVQ